MAAAIHALRTIEEEQPSYNTEPIKREIGFGIVDPQVRALKNGYATAVYEVLAAHANPEGVSWPPLTTICDLVGWSKPTVIKAIKALTDAGLVTVEQQRHHGMIVGNRYTLPLRNRTKSTTFTQPQSIKTEQVNDVYSGGKGDLPRQSTTLTQMVNDVDLGGKRRLHKQDVVKQDSKKQEVNDSSSTIEQRFDLFWQAYPRRTGKQAALKIWQRIGPDDELTARMIEAVGVQKKSRDWQKDGGQYIPYPATWLNQGRWDDDPIFGEYEKRIPYNSPRAKGPVF